MLYLPLSPPSDSHSGYGFKHLTGEAGSREKRWPKGDISRHRQTVFNLSQLQIPTCPPCPRSALPSNLTVSAPLSSSRAGREELETAAKPSASAALSHPPAHTCSATECKSPEMWINNNLSSRHSKCQSLPSTTYMCLQKNQVQQRHARAGVKRTKPSSAWTRTEISYLQVWQQPTYRKWNKEIHYCKART